MNYYLTEEHFWRGPFFNRIIKELDYSSYLELGVSTGEKCFNLIKCEKKIGIDKSPELNIPDVFSLSTDDYFTLLSDEVKFDLIFIDALHEKVQVYRDFCNSINHLNPHGMIILHDIYPLTEQHSVQTCNGDCYEFWMELVERYPKKTAVFTGHYNDQEGTVGIYFGNEFDRNKIKNIDRSYDHFSKNISKYIHDKELTEKEIILRGTY